MAETPGSSRPRPIYGQINEGQEASGSLLHCKMPRGRAPVARLFHRFVHSAAGTPRGVLTRPANLIQATEKQSKKRNFMLLFFDYATRS
jgi:hypothetical protein